MSTPLPQHLRAALAHPALAGLWERARARLETTGLVPTGKISVPIANAETARELGALLCRRAPSGTSVSIDLAELDTLLRRGAASRSLLEVLTALTGPLTSRPAAKIAKQTSLDEVEAHLHRALTTHRLHDSPWVKPWLSALRRQGILARIAQNTAPAVLANRTAAVLSHMHLDPTMSPAAATDRGDLASRYAGGAHALDDDQFLTTLILRAAAFAHHVDAPTDARGRRDMWNRCAVTVDEVSTTLMTWALPILGDDPWACRLRERTELGLETHLTRRELRRMRPEDTTPLVAPGTQIAVCENPRILAAAADRGLPHPLICTFGNPTTLAIYVLERLVKDGAAVRYHGDFDPAGLTITAYILAIPGITPWRMDTAGYLEALAYTRAHGIDLPAIDGAVPATPWDPALASALHASATAVEEEVLLDLLLTDLS